MRKGQIHSIKYLEENRKQLRKNLTAAEVKLWQVLRGEQLQGRKFRRQHSIEHYIVDFYCPSEKLIVELDGPIHYHQETELNDQVRDARLTQLGFTVLRFENKDVYSNLTNVLQIISNHFKKI